jgi:hypothetical protein
MKRWLSCHLRIQEIKNIPNGSYVPKWWLFSWKGTFSVYNLPMRIPVQVPNPPVVRATEYISLQEMKQGQCICPLSWSVHCNFTGDGKCNKRGWACTPHPRQSREILPSWLNVRQKADVTTLCSLWSVHLQCSLYTSYSFRPYQFNKGADIGIGILRQGVYAEKVPFLAENSPF